MSGCFGGSDIDRWMESNLDAYLDGKDEASVQVEYVCSMENAYHEEYDLFTREDGSQFEVVQWPTSYPDCDEDGPCGIGWTSYKIREVVKEESEE